MFNKGDVCRVKQGYNTLREKHTMNSFSSNFWGVPIADNAVVVLHDGVIEEIENIAWVKPIVGNGLARVPIKFLQHDLISQHDYQRRHAPDFALKMATLVMKLRNISYHHSLGILKANDAIDLRMDCLDYARCIAGEKDWQEIHDYLTDSANWLTGFLNSIGAAKGAV